MTSVVRLLQQAGCFVPESHERAGNPAYDQRALGDLLRRLPVRIAAQVCRERLRFGSRRGSLASAIRVVAERHRIDPEAVKKYHQRYRSLVEEVVIAAHKIGLTVDEVERRTANFPSVEKDKLFAVASPLGLLEFLRQHDVRGVATNDLIDWIRSL